MACVLPAPAPAAKRRKVEQTPGEAQLNVRPPSSIAMVAQPAERSNENARRHGGHALDAPRSSLADRVTQAVLQQWDKLPKTGKPQPHEHTCLAAFVMEYPAAASESQCPQQMSGWQPEEANVQSADESVLTVVAIGTGMKCLSAEARSDTGRLINDSHAEAIARRALQRWMYGQLTALVQRSHASTRAFTGYAGPGQETWASGCDFFELVDPPAGCGPFARLRHGCRLHMWVSQPPCGDASIVNGAEVGGADPQDTKRGVANAMASAQQASHSLGGWQRTGAKPIREPVVSQW